MQDKFMEKARVVKQTCIASGIYSMYLWTEKIAAAAKPGQFVSVYSNDNSRMLPRPLSLCEIDRELGVLRIVYRVAGAGTKEFSMLQPGELVEIAGPMGNGFPLDALKEGQKAFLMGGGIGIPPILQLTKELTAAGKDVTVVLGYRDELFLLEEFQQTGAEVVIATEDGSAGTKGNVLDAIRANGLSADLLYACGPTPMLRALQSYAQENNMESYLSLEQKMACGIGACLACVCKSKEKDSHSNVNNKRVCAEGPVFNGRDIEL